jgi:hypothetical protein
MRFYEKTLIEQVCISFVRWNGWGPPTSKFQIMEFCRATEKTKEDSVEATEILEGWMRGEHNLKKNPLW